MDDVVIFSLCLLSIALICMLLGLRCGAHETLTMDDCLKRAWPVSGSRVRRWMARRHNAVLVLNVAYTMQAMSWCQVWDAGIRATLEDMETSARVVRRGLLAVFWDGVDSAYERMVLDVTQLCFLLRPDLVHKVEEVL